MNVQRNLVMSGSVKAKVIHPKGPGFMWRFSNIMTWHYLKSLFAVFVVRPIANMFGLLTAHAELRAILFKADGTVINYGVLSYRVITDAGVAYLVDAWQNTVELETMKYHGCGTGTTAEAASQTALVTESTTALNPDSTRATGSLTEASAAVFQTVGTLTFDASAAVTEHGLFSQAATGGGTMWDRSLFSAINVASGDSIQFTYSLTVSSGG